MINMRALPRSVLAGVLVLAGLSIAPPAFAEKADLELIQSYVGNWRGRGTMANEGQESETVVCRLEITRSSDEKIGFSGRCALAGGNLSMAGTMAYIVAANRYEAIITSNTSFTGTAIGKRRGSNVTFNLQGRDKNGEISRVRAGFGLNDGKIMVEFEVTNADGSKILANVPFDRRG